MSTNAFDDQCTGANPRYPLISDIKEMYKLAFYGKAYQKNDATPVEVLPCMDEYTA